MLSLHSWKIERSGTGLRIIGKDNAGAEHKVTGIAYVEVTNHGMMASSKGQIPQCHLQNALAKAGSPK